jgi:hypothetical protein
MKEQASKRRTVLHFCQVNIILYDRNKEKPMSDQDWVVVDEIAGELEAEIMRGFLEAQGIEVVLSQEGLGHNLQLGVGPLGRVQLLVPGKQAEQAKALLEAYYRGDYKDTELVEDDGSS